MERMEVNLEANLEIYICAYIYEWYRRWKKNNCLNIIDYSCHLVPSFRDEYETQLTFVSSRPIHTWKHVPWIFLSFFPRFPWVDGCFYVEPFLLRTVGHFEITRTLKVEIPQFFILTEKKYQFVLLLFRIPLIFHCLEKTGWHEYSLYFLKNMEDPSKTF